MVGGTDFGPWLDASPYDRGGGGGGGGGGGRGRGGVGGQKKSHDV